MDKDSSLRRMRKQSRILAMNKRTELNELIKSLLIAASEPSVNAKVDWKNYMQIVSVLQKITEMEKFKSINNREKHFDDLLGWIKLHGGIINNISISEFEDMEFGLQALSGLKEGDIVCSVPRKLMITLENVQKSPLKHLYNNDPILTNMGNIALALFLILEYLKGDSSFWYAYISSLPAKYNTVLYFEVDDFKELQSSPTFVPAIKLCKNIARQYAYFYQVFQKSDDAASRLLRNKFTYQLYRWAVSTVMTRQNFIPSEDNKSSINSLIPLWDMCNHMNGLLTTQYIEDTSSSECRTFKPFSKGEQVLIFYGKRSNADFLLHNGFVYPGNEHDTYRLRLGISKDDPLYEERSTLLNRLNISISGDFFLNSGSNPLDFNLIAFLRIFNMDKENLKYWSDSNRIEDLGCIGCAIDKEIERKVWNFLLNRIKLLLAGYPESPKMDETVSASRKLVRLLCDLEVKLLKSVLDYVQQHIQHNLP